jgi:hypothetical protein
MISGSRSENIFFGCVEVKLSHVLIQIEVVNVFFTGSSPLAVKVNPPMVIILLSNRELNCGRSYESDTE